MSKIVQLIAINSLNPQILLALEIDFTVFFFRDLDLVFKKENFVPAKPTIQKQEWGGKLAVDIKKILIEKTTPVGRSG